MTAIALDIDDLKPTAKDHLWSVVEKDKGRWYADLYVGPRGGNMVPYTPGQQDIDRGMVAEEAQLSLDTCTCLFCDDDGDLGLYEHDDGEPAFYLCADCEEQFAID